ncbi:antitermination protein [Serratia liquefaciens]|uniref:antitermination protein n=1 Tax=Serratia liquefaciens TaxID=614 RepID=UPI0021C83B1B|nr:antitermination protein [Serratia liquefaciens]
MRLESIPKYFAPKSPTFSDSPRATASDSLTGTDVIAAFGMCQAQAELGLSAFLGKMGVSDADKVKAVLLLAEKGMADSIRVAPLRKLQVEARAGVVLALSVFAFLDYSRSADSIAACDACCDGFIEERKFVMNKLAHAHDTVASFVRGDLPASIQPIEGREMLVKHTYYDVTKKVCNKCNGKKVISTACRDCSGRCEAIDREETERQGVPVKRACKRCGGRGYERIPASRAFDAVQQVTDAISLATWEKTVKPFYDGLIRTLECEENHAEQALRRVTA